jgi:hypothetical protein
VYNVVGRKERYVLVKTTHDAREYIAKHTEQTTTTV